MLLCTGSPDAALYCTKLLRVSNQPLLQLSSQIPIVFVREKLRDHEKTFDGNHDIDQRYNISLKIGHGFTYSKYNTLMHFLNVAGKYWHNPDLNSVSVFDKDIRTLLAISCQKIFFEEGHSYYHYGPVEAKFGYTTYGAATTDLQVGISSGNAMPSVCREKKAAHTVVVTDRVYEYHYLAKIVEELFESANGTPIKTGNVALNLCLLSLLLDFGES